MPTKVTILCPVYDDAASLHQLMAELGKTFGALQQYELSFVVVNDGSHEAIGIPSGFPHPVEIIHLHRNLGHQKAIAIGLAHIHLKCDCNRVLVMDSDGEDRPSDCLPLLAASEGDRREVVFARRKSRQESPRFRFFYRLYKALFRLLTGKRISFGNFMVIPKPELAKIVYYTEIWSNLASGIIRTGLPYTTIETHRGRRYSGRSKMNFTALTLHGLSAIAVFLDLIAFRLLAFSFLIILASLVVILAVLFIKAFTSLAIPGWASTVITSMLVVLLQSFLLSLFVIFLYLTAQSQRNFIPANHYTDFIQSIQTGHGSDRA